MQARALRVLQSWPAFSLTFLTISGMVPSAASWLHASLVAGVEKREILLGTEIGEPG
jgi:hypothetical protein